MPLEHEALTEGRWPATRVAIELRQDDARTEASHCFLRLFLPSCIPYSD